MLYSFSQRWLYKWQDATLMTLNIVGKNCDVMEFEILSKKIHERTQL